MTASIFLEQNNNINFNRINNLVETDETLFLYSLNKHHTNQLKSYPPYYPLDSILYEFVINWLAIIIT